MSWTGGLISRVTGLVRRCMDPVRETLQGRWVGGDLRGGSGGGQDKMWRVILGELVMTWS